MLSVENNLQGEILAIVWASGETCLHMLSQELILCTGHQHNSQGPTTWDLEMSDLMLGTQTARDENSWQKGSLG